MSKDQNLLTFRCMHMDVGGLLKVAASSKKTKILDVLSPTHMGGQTRKRLGLQQTKMYPNRKFAEIMKQVTKV